MMRDPYPKRKVHKAKLIDQQGRVSPLCARVPRPLNLSKESWTLTGEVTCKRCLAVLAEEQAG